MALRGRRTGRIAVFRGRIGCGTRTGVVRGGATRASGWGGKDKCCDGSAFAGAGDVPARWWGTGGSCGKTAATAGMETAAGGTVGALPGRVEGGPLRARSATGGGRDTREDGRGRGAGVEKRRRASQPPPAAAAAARSIPPPRGTKRGRRRNVEARPTGRTEGIGSGAFREARSRSTSLRRLTFGRSSGANATRADGGSRCRERRRVRDRARPTPPPPRRRRAAPCARRR